MRFFAGLHLAVIGNKHSMLLEKLSFSSTWSYCTSCIHTAAFSRGNPPITRVLSFYQTLWLPVELQNPRSCQPATHPPKIDGVSMFKQTLNRWAEVLVPAMGWAEQAVCFASLPLKKVWLEPASKLADLQLHNLLN